MDFGSSSALFEKLEAIGKQPSPPNSDVNHPQPWEARTISSAIRPLFTYSIFY